MLSIAELLALAIFSSYFIVIIVLFLIIVKSLPGGTQDPGQWRYFAFSTLALGSFAHTWFYMFKFLSWSFANFRSNAGGPSNNNSVLSQVTSWLSGTGLFEQAWSAVSFGEFNWWWSEQLCLFTVGAWTTFLATEGHGIKYLWAYMLLGQLVAISVATNLFYLALSLSPRTHSPSYAMPRLWFSVLLSLVTVALSPFTTHRTFLPNLLAMHALIVLPLFFQRPASEHPSRFSIRVSSLYTLVAIISAALRLRTTAVAILSLPVHSRTALGFFNTTIEILYSHPAQSSIGWDVIWTSISFIVWICIRPSDEQQVSRLVMNAPLALAATSLASVGVATPWVLRRMNEQKEKVKAE